MPWLFWKLFMHPTYINFDTISFLYSNTTLLLPVVHFDFRIGGGISDRIVMYFWMTLNETTSDWEHVNPGESIFAGFGSSIYIKPTTPSLYLILGGGTVSGWRGNILSSKKGFGITGGIGYEFVRHLSTELNVMYGKATSQAWSLYGGGPEYEMSFFALALSIIAIAY